MKQTPLYETHQQAGARLVEFGGWAMPVQYEGIIEEHNQTRSAASVFDICHMGEFRVKGPSASSFLGKLITSNVQDLAVGRCKYGLLLNEEGKIQDDLIAYRIADDEYMVVVNAATTESDLAWFKKHCPEDVELTDISDETAKIDVQGPTSIEIMNAMTDADLSELKYFRWVNTTIDGIEALVSRTGYTGELGVEIYFNAADAVTLWNKIVAAGVKPAGLGARDTLRLEAALPLSGQDIGPNTTPVHANQLRFVQKDKEFIGKSSLPSESEIDQILTGFKIESRQSARHDNKVMDGENEVGIVTSASFSPTLGYSIGLAYMPPVMAEEGKAFVINNGRKNLDATVAALPFYKR